MSFHVTNIYGNTALTDKGYKADYGNAFIIESDGRKILYDTGWKGDILLHNFQTAGIDPDSIDILVFSHGHFDHTGGLKEFLQSRTKNKPLQVFLHPDALKKKHASFIARVIMTLKLKEKIKDFGFTELPENLKDKITFEFITDTHEIIKGLYSLGEITERPEKDATQFLLQKDNDNDKWGKDMVMDDLSLVCETKNGLALICGCCHAGILNTLKKIEKQWPGKNIEAIIGGTHMMIFKKEDLENISTNLKKNHNTPKLYLNHCSGEKTITYFKDVFGDEITKPMHVGDSMKIE
ncbi:MAG TPA: MBL fold metallo-hydrolase [Spirochaetota bacterium]|nr:MBL fold metallo-hydrolase [Spirochaetota bacterium]